MHFANHEFDPSKDPLVQDVTSYRASRFPYLLKLAYNLLGKLVSSASSEREFSIARWHCLGRKNRTEEEVLAAKVFLTYNRDLLRHLLFGFGFFSFVFLYLFNQQFLFFSVFFSLFNTAIFNTSNQGRDLTVSKFFHYITLQIKKNLG